MSERIGSQGWRIWKEKRLPQEVVPLSDAEGVVAQLEARIEQWEQEAKDNTVMRDAGGRPMTEMENWWMDEKKRCLQLEEENAELKRENKRHREFLDTIMLNWEEHRAYKALLTAEEHDEQT